MWCYVSQRGKNILWKYNGSPDSRKRRMTKLLKGRTPKIHGFVLLSSPPARSSGPNPFTSLTFMTSFASCVCSYTPKMDRSSTLRKHLNILVGFANHLQGSVYTKLTSAHGSPGPRPPDRAAPSLQCPSSCSEETFSCGHQLTPAQSLTVASGYPQHELTNKRKNSSPALWKPCAVWLLVPLRPHLMPSSTMTPHPTLCPSPRSSDKPSSSVPGPLPLPFRLLAVFFLQTFT